jgi:hypothetical protein
VAGTDSARLQAYLQQEIKIIQAPKSPVATIIYNPDADFAGTMLSASTKSSRRRPAFIDRSNDSDLL